MKEVISQSVILAQEAAEKLNWRLTNRNLINEALQCYSFGWKAKSKASEILRDAAR